MAKRKKPPIKIGSRTELELRIAELVELRASLAKARADIESEKARIESEAAAVLAPALEDVPRLEASIQAYASEHRADLFGAAKSLDTISGTIGFRTNPPAVERMSSKDAWCAIALRLEALPWGEMFVRYPEPEVDKALILELRGSVTEHQLGIVGLRIGQGETFYIQPNADVQGTRLPASAAQEAPL